MKTILFRGKCAISGDWVFGDLIHGVGHKSGNLYMLPNKTNLAYVKHCDPLDGVRIDPETVGQYTGLDDKDGNKIFENDILRYVNHHEKGHPYYVHHVVKWSSKYNMWYCFHTKNKQEEGIQGNCFLYAYANASPSFERIGSVNDNPELI